MNVTHDDERFVRATRKKINCSDGGDCGSKKWKRGCGGLHNDGAWRSLRLAGI